MNDVMICAAMMLGEIEHNATGLDCALLGLGQGDGGIEVVAPIHIRAASAADIINRLRGWVYEYAGGSQKSVGDDEETWRFSAGFVCNSCK